MKSELFSFMRFDADEGYVFDWLEPHFEEDKDGNQIRQHLYAKTLFIGKNDAIDNYIEVIKPIEEEE